MRPVSTSLSAIAGGVKSTPVIFAKNKTGSSSRSAISSISGTSIDRPPSMSEQTRGFSSFFFF